MGNVYTAKGLFSLTFLAPKKVMRGSITQHKESQALPTSL